MDEKRMLKVEERLAALEAIFLNQKEILTFKEACVYTGISRSTLYKMTHSSAIPFYRPNGKLIYFEKSELLAWMRRNRSMTEEEANEKAHELLQRMAKN